MKNELNNTAVAFASLPIGDDNEPSDIELTYDRQPVYQPYLGTQERLEEIVNRDLEIIQRRMDQYNSRAADHPRVGDFFQRLDGSLDRFVHDWGQAHGIQVYPAHSGSFYLGDGFIEHSGGLNSCVAFDQIQPTDETMLGSIWIFSQGLAGAHRGVTASVRFRVFREAQPVNPGPLTWHEGPCNSCLDSNAWVTSTAGDGNVCGKCFEKYYDPTTGEALSYLNEVTK